MSSNVDILSAQNTTSTIRHRPWSNIGETPDNLEKLQLLRPSQKQLKEVGYVMQALSDNDILSKVRCSNCKERFKPRFKLEHSNSRHWPTLTRSDAGVRSETAQKQTPPKAKCYFHTGRVSFKFFTCCDQPVSSKGCTFNAEHSFVTTSINRTLRNQWAFHTTISTQAFPSSGGTERRVRNIREAVALDCEMGVSQSGESELIKLTMIDFFTGEILIDSLVCPSVPMKHYNTRYSGVTAVAMRSAIQKRSCIFGRDAARRTIREYVDPNTTAVIMHGGNNDLRALRWIHPFVIDTFILQNMWGKEKGGHSLRNLCDKKLGITIQTGRLGHCSLEDARACRELLYWYMQQIPNSIDSLMDNKKSETEII